jgi:hypothetical protein
LLRVCLPRKKKNRAKVNEDVLSDIKVVVDTNQTTPLKLENGETVDIDAPTANVLLTVLNALEEENKKRMVELLTKSTADFLKVVDFCWKNVK